MSNLTSVSAASYSAQFLAPDSIVSAFGANLSPVTQSTGGNFPTTLSGINVNIIDNSGNTYNPQLYLVSPGMVKFVLNDAVADGEAVVSVVNDGQTMATGFVQVASVAPAIFSADSSGQGVAAGIAALTSNDATSSTTLASYNAAQGTWTPVAIDVTQNATLTLYATGIRHRSSLANVSLTVTGVNVPVTFAGANPQAVGVNDLIAGPLPASLAGERRCSYDAERRRARGERGQHTNQVRRHNEFQPSIENSSCPADSAIRHAAARAGVEILAHQWKSDCGCQQSSGADVGRELVWI